MVWVVKHGRDFAFPDYKANYPRDPLFKLVHVFLRIWLYVLEKKIDGEVELTFIPKFEKMESITLDAVDMDIKSVEWFDGPLRYVYDGEKLKILFDRELKKGEKYKVKVIYSARPRVGLYFILPDNNKSNIQPQVWSQGEPEYTRYWIPIYDYPNNKCTSEIIAYAPKEFTVLSNGRLVETFEDDEWKAWHWKMDYPHSTYLITIVAGIFDYIEENFDGIPLYYYVPKGMGEYIHRSFSRTKDILMFFSEFTGVRYPYDQYVQVCVSEFVVGGMENTTITVLTDRTLHDEKAHMDFESEPLVAHEAAHQWFGDLVTTKDWGNIWINESFATYLENLYVRHWKGDDEFIYELYRDLKMYLDEYKKRYSRPIVTRVYKYPSEVFDAHSYPKGGLVLHTLLNLVGEDKFREAINLFLNKFKFSNADTEDLRKIFEEVTDLDLEWFFDQYVYNAGHPVISFSYDWLPETKTLKIVIKQVQKEDSLDVYKMKLDLVILTKSKTINKEVNVRERELTLYIPMEEEPEAVYLDPEFKVFKEMILDLKQEQLIKILKGDYIYPKFLALEKITKYKSVKVLNELASLVKNNEEFWGVRAEAVKSIGLIGLEEGLDILIELEEKISHPKIRRAIAEALGNYKNAKSAELLKKILENHKESYYVRQSAAVSLGKTKQPEAFDILLKEINTPSHNDVITRGVLRGLSEIGSDEALDIIISYMDKTKPTFVRAEATLALGRFPGIKKAFDALIDALRDENFRVRSAAILASLELMDPKLLPHLEKIALEDLEESLKRRAREVISKIKRNLEKGVEYKLLREELERIKEKNRKLLDRIERIESKI